MTAQLILKRASASRPSGQWSDDDFDVLADGALLRETLPPMPHRPEVHRWYCTASWQRRRAHQLHIEPLCRLCLEAGRVTPATVADHVTPHRGDYNAFRLGQLRSLCADCHNELDANNAPRAPVRADGTPSDPRHPWNARS